MAMNFKSQIEGMNGIYEALGAASKTIYDELKKGEGLKFATSSNESGDDQIELDVIADNAFFDALSKDENVRYVVSEERPDLMKVSDGPYSVALDPIDGSKAALIGIPCGAIFGIWKNADVAADFHGGNILAGGFFVFGMNLEVYFADGDAVYRGQYDEATAEWTILPHEAPMPSANIIAINGQMQKHWGQWLQDYISDAVTSKDGKAPTNMRWFSSMVADMKRMFLQGGLFAYPAADFKGYETGKLRLVYEAIPMSYLITKMGGASTNGDMSLLEMPVEKLHQKVPVFIGDADKITALEAAKKAG